MRAAKEKTLSFKSESITGSMDSEAARIPATTTTSTVVNRISNYDFTARKFQKPPIGTSEKIPSIVPVENQHWPRKRIGESRVHLRRLHWGLGTMYFRARMYEPTTGEFISQDPLGFVDGKSMYRGYFLVLGIDPRGDTWYVPDDRRGGAKNPLNHLDFDFAGRQLLWWWLYGGGKKRIIEDDADWTYYMERNEKLRLRVRNRLVTKAWELCEKPGNFTEDFTLKFQAEFKKGEGVIGYHYLGGTNPNFIIEGQATVTHATPDASGCKCCTVSFSNKYMWLDVMDPNLQYDTDALKAAFGWVLSGGQSEDYELEINWHDDSIYKLDAQCLYTNSGWPLAKRPKKPEPFNPGLPKPWEPKY